MGSTSIHEKGPWDWMKGGAEGGGEGAGVLQQQRCFSQDADDSDKDAAAFR